MPCGARARAHASRPHGRHRGRTGGIAADISAEVLALSVDFSPRERGLRVWGRVDREPEAAGNERIEPMLDAHSQGILTPRANILASHAPIGSTYRVVQCTLHHELRPALQTVPCKVELGTARAGSGCCH
jgi:hypothetical protein